MSGLDYIADDLGIDRCYTGEEGPLTVTALTWVEVEDIVVEEGLLKRLTEERAMDEWETR